MSVYSRARLRYVFIWFMFVLFFVLCNIDVYGPPHKHEFADDLPVNKYVLSSGRNASAHGWEGHFDRFTALDKNSTVEKVMMTRKNTLSEFCVHFKKWLSHIRKAEGPEHFQGISDINQQHYYAFPHQGYLVCVAPSTEQYPWTHFTEDSPVALPTFDESLKWKTFKSFIESNTSVLFVQHPFSRILTFYLEDIRDISKSRIAEWLNQFSAPTFKEFLLFLINQSLFDLHPATWPTACYCGTCAIPYDFILKAETWERDVTVLSQVSKMPSPTYPGVTVTDNIYQQYWSAIPEDLKMWVYKKYKADFEMFRYFPDSHSFTTLE